MEKEDKILRHLPVDDKVTKIGWRGDDGKEIPLKPFSPFVSKNLIYKIKIKPEDKETQKEKPKKRPPFKTIILTDE